MTPPTPETETPMSTNEQQHTPEPWLLRKKWKSSETPLQIWAKDRKVKRPMIPTEIASVYELREDADANAARIVACVNACAGIPDPATALPAAVRALEYFFQIATFDPEQKDLPRQPRAKATIHQHELDIAIELATAALAAMKGVGGE